MIRQITKLNDIVDILTQFEPYLDDIRNGRVKINEISLKFYKCAFFFIIEENEKIIGLISFYCNDKIKYIAYVSMIVVLPEYTKMGYGRKLIDKAIEISRKNEMKYMKLEVDKENLNAINFYYKIGFKKTEIETDRSYYLKIIL